MNVKIKETNVYGDSFSSIKLSLVDNFKESCYIFINNDAKMLLILLNKS